MDSPRLHYQRGLLHEAVNARILRLHRPFLSRGYQDGSPFATSTRVCVAAAKAIISGNHAMSRIANSLWSVYTGTLGSAIVLFMDLFHAIDAGTAEEDLVERREVLLKGATAVFATQVASPALQAVVEQGQHILLGLIMAEEDRRHRREARARLPDGGSGNPELDSFAQVLKRISREVQAEEAYVPSTDSWPPAMVPRFSGGSDGFAAGLGFEPTSVPGGGVDGAIEGGGGQDFSSFFETMASEDWGQGGGIAAPGWAGME